MVSPWARIRVDGLGRRHSRTYDVEDTGRLVKGHIIDIFMADCDAAKEFGRRPARVRVLRVGDGEGVLGGGAHSELVSRLPGPPRYWRHLALKPQPDPARRQKWVQRWNPFRQCSWPPEDDRALARLKRACGIPLAVGENASSATDLERIVDSEAAQYVQPSVIKLGLTAAWRIAQKCADTRVVCAPQVAFFGPGYLASLHLIAAQQAEVSLERLYVELAHVPYGDSVPIVDGWVGVPDGPGLGADPEAALAEGRFST